MGVRFDCVMMRDRERVELTVRGLKMRFGNLDRSCSLFCLFVYGLYICGLGLIDKN